MGRQEGAKRSGHFQALTQTGVVHAGVPLQWPRSAAWQGSPPCLQWSEAPLPTTSTALEQYPSKTSRTKMFYGLCMGWYQL